MQSAEGKKLVSLSPRAIEKVKEILNKKTSPEMKRLNGLRVFAAKGCCSNQYGMALEDQAKSGDIEWNEDGISIYVDAQSAALLKGSRIDFVETAQGSGFKIDNPRADSSSC